MVLFEDDPYRDLAYDSSHRTPIAARMHGGSRLLLDESLARRVAFMPGEEFFPNKPLLGTMRLDFTHAGNDADRGVRILAELGV